MTARGEKMLMLHLLDRDSLAVIAREGIETEAVPSAEMRHIVEWSIAYFFRSGMAQAPSLAALRGVEAGSGKTFGDIFDDHEVPIGDDPDDTIEWALDDLRASYVHKETQRFLRDMAQSMADASEEDRVDVLAAQTNNLIALNLSLVKRDTAVEVKEGLTNVLFAYEGRAANQGVHQGATFGLPEVDAHTYRLHDGEVGVLAAGPKMGKSFWMTHVALAEHEEGRASALFSLENTVQMTLDRMACQKVRIDYARWQQGICSDEEVESVRAFQADLEKSDVPLWVIQPDLGRRSMEQMVREAQVRGAQTILIDQLSFVELPSPRKPKHERIGEAMHTLKGLIATGRDRMPCFLASQINREGMAVANKLGHHDMSHMAEAAEIERTADFVCSIYGSNDAIIDGQRTCQILAARRVPIKNWVLRWRPSDLEGIRVMHEITL